MRLKLLAIGWAALYSSAGHAANVYLVGGQDNGLTTPYTALISNSGVATEVTVGLPAAGNIVTVAINPSGYGIIGGKDSAGSGPGYAALVDQTAVASPLSFGLGVTGQINSVVINNSRQAIIGGVDQGVAFLGLVSPSGIVTDVSSNLPVGLSNIINVGINESGNGLFAAISKAGLVSSSGVVTNLTGSIPSGGFTFLQDAAINNSGSGVISGNDASFAAYVALISPTGVVTPVTGQTPTGSGRITDVAINDSGAAICCGQHTVMSASVPYLAVISPSGVATEIPALFPGTNYESVAINSSGTALIGGSKSGFTQQNLLPASSTIQIPLTGDLPSGAGTTRSVAINNNGEGIIGGQDGSSLPFVRLVSPSGDMTNISGELPTGTGVIRSVSIAIAPAILSALTPSTVGPAFGGPMIASLLAASTALTDHVDLFHKWHNRASRSNPELSLLAESEISMSCSRKQKTQGIDAAMIPAPDSYSLWISPFYDLIQQSAQSSFPSSSIQVAGAVLGFEYWPSERLVVGGGPAYAYSYVHAHSSLGHSSIHEALLTCFTSYKWDHLFLNASVWGGYYNLDSDRHTLGFITSTSNTHGWLLNPHLELCGANYSKQFEPLFIELFAMVDWVNNWQAGYTEQGSAGFNLIVPSMRNELLRSEVGMTFYQTLNRPSGTVFLRERAGFINKTPFHFQPTTTAFVGSFSNFTIATGTNKMQNLAGVQLFASWISNKVHPLFWQIGFSGEFNASYQSYFTSAELGKNF